MKRSLVLFGLVLVGVLFAGTVFAADDDVTLTGTVSVTKGDDGAVTAVKLTVDKTVYNVVLDDNGKKLAELNAKKVEVTGTVATKDEVKTLTVKTMKEVVEKKVE